MASKRSPSSGGVIFKEVGACLLALGSFTAFAFTTCDTAYALGLVGIKSLASG